MTLDLFTPVVPKDRFHPAFTTLFRDATEQDKQVLGTWSEGFVDRDGKFVKEFQTTFDSSFWELYLFAAFKDLGFECDFGFERPDFCIKSPQAFNVEATVSLNARGTTPVTETNPIDFPRDYNVFNKQAIVRLANSVHSKHKKYLKSYSQLGHVIGKPFVLAIAPFDRPHFQLQAQRAVEALLYRAYVDEETYLREHPNRDIPLRAKDLPEVQKESGEVIPLGLFCNDSMADVSAVIQSTAATWSKVRVMSRDPDVMVTAIYENRRDGGQDIFRGPNEKYTETILDGLRIYHNPHAKIPLESSLFVRPEIFQATSSGPVNVIAMGESRRLLANRTVMTFLPVGTMARVLKDMPPDKTFWQHIR